MSWQIVQRNGFYLPEIDWYLDAREPVERSFVSHAHYDHMGKHETILCSAPTAELVRQRLSGERNWQIYEFGEVFEISQGVRACFYPAGHIVGSTMLWLEKEGKSFLYSGDFKLSPGSSAERCQPVEADTLVVETTYGLPRYTFPPENDVFEDIIRFCRDTLENGDTPVLFGYSLGKSQAILKWLEDAELEVMLHPKAFKLTRSCQKLGWTFPRHFPFDERNHRGKVIISPPMTKDCDWLQSIHNPKTAMISGWAIDSSAVYRYQCDKAFPLSDHADYLDLQSFVAKVNPKTVYTVHGFAKEFAATLREQGYQAWALGHENQLGLAIAETPPTEPSGTEPSDSPILRSIPTNSFAALSQVIEALEGTDSLRTKQGVLNDYFTTLELSDVSAALKFLENLDDQFSSELPPNLVRQSLILACGATESEYNTLYQKVRDRLIVAKQLLDKNQTRTVNTLGEMSSFLQTLTIAPNPAFKQSLLQEKFKNLTPQEGTLLFAFLCGSLRTGMNFDLLCKAIAHRFERTIDSVKSAYLRSCELNTVLDSAANDELEKIQIRYFQPISFLVPRTEPSPEAIIEKHGLSLWAEPEHHGMRCQIHKNVDHVELYSSEGKRITHLFPELIESARTIPQHFIGDSVIVAWGYEAPLPRSELEKRLTRKAEELFLGEDVAVVLWLFDLLCLDGIDLLDLPLEKRRQKLDTFSVDPKIRITPVLPLSGAIQIEEALAKVSASGNSGLVFKDSTSPYNPLSNESAWLRLDPKPPTFG